MKADEARELAINSALDEIETVKRRIRKAAEAGQLSINLTNLSTAAKEWLTENGYKLEHHNTANWDIENICW